MSRSPGDPYRALAAHLDHLPAGYPATDSGVELRILRQLFSREEAELALHLTLIPERAHVVAHRAGRAPQETEAMLRAMAGKGLCVGLQSERGPARYLALQFAIGIWELSLNRLTPQLARDMGEYSAFLMEKGSWKQVPQLRTIPVGRAIEARADVLSYERAEQLVARRRRIALAPCICRRERALEGHGCGKLDEACLLFGLVADIYVRNGLGRPIQAHEALAVLREAESQGLVLQPGNSRKPSNICCCCPCCCAVLRNIQHLPQPAALLACAFEARVDAQECTGCSACLRRCPMDALSLDDGCAVVEPARCIGCGLCVPRCKDQALSLQRREGAARPFRTGFHRDWALARSQGRLGPGEIASLLLSSAKDKLLAKKGPGAR